MGNLSSAVDELFAVDVRELPDAALMDDLVELDKAINRCKAAFLTRLEVLDRRGGVKADFGSTGAWLRGALRVTPTQAYRDVHLARDLADVLPAVAAAMADGETSVVHAQVLAGLRKDLRDEVVASIDPHLADAARRMDPVALRGFVTAVRHSYARERVVHDERTAYDERRLHASATLNGTGVGNWTGDPVSHETIMTAIHAASRPVAGDDRTPAQRRFDGLLTLCEIALSSGKLPDVGGVKPHVSVTLPIDTLQGMPGAAPAHTAFGATISAEAARRIACDAAISRIITGPMNEILDAGRAARTFTAAQRRAIVARDAHCIWPGCDAPPGWCDAHHIVHWADGGPTSVENGALLCGRHHDRVHHHGHAIVKDPDTGRLQVHPVPGTDPNWRGKERVGPLRR